MEEPPSPGVRPVELKDCMEELLRFTLISSIQRKIQTGLSDQYCAHFLQHDPPAPIHTHAVPGGVPPYPLYKQLASSLYQSLLGALYTSKSELVPAHENLNLRKIDGECYKMIMEKGPILLSTLKEVNFELHVQEPFFSLLSDGVKTIEGRCAVGDYRRIQEGHVLIFNKCLTLQVQDVRHYSSFREMLELESLASVLPGVTSIEEEISTQEKERSNGVLAICVQKPTSQLHVILASILSGLSYGGVQKLLGFAETVGTNPELLTPPHNPHV